MSDRFVPFSVRTLVAILAASTLSACSVFQGNTLGNTSTANARSYWLASDWDGSQPTKAPTTNAPVPARNAPPVAALELLPTTEQRVEVSTKELPPIETESKPLAQMQDGMMVPVGQCWAQLVIPSRVTQEVQDVVTQEGRLSYSVQPAQLRTDKLAFVRKEGAETFRVQPPTYTQVTESVKVKDEVKKMVVEPAIYQEKTEDVLVESAHIVLRSCRAAGLRIAGTKQSEAPRTQCATEVPARYKAVKRLLLVKAESVREEITPAVYKTITKMVLNESAKVIPVPIPPVTINLPVTTVDTPAVVATQEVPAMSSQITVKQHTSIPQVTWRRVLCEKDAPNTLIKEVQTALRDKGEDVGTVDGKLGQRTLNAVQTYQARQGLASGLLTYETLDALGITTSAK